jgi:hypothetical protein
MIYFPSNQTKKVLKENSKKHLNGTGEELLSGLIGDKGLNTNVSVDIPVKTVVIAVVGIVAAVGLSVLVAKSIKKA